MMMKVFRAMTIMARYSDICRHCGQRWQPGDLIRSQVVGAEHHEHWVHVACPNPLLEALIKHPIKRAAEGG